MDNFSQNTIVVEFEAPFPVDTENVDYEKLATQRRSEMIRKGEIKFVTSNPLNYNYLIRVVLRRYNYADLQQRIQTGDTR